MTITSPTSVSLQERVARYLAKCGPAISGQGGHDQTFFVACQLVNGFGLDESSALEWLRRYSESCQPPWSEKDLLHKVKSAQQAAHNNPRGHLLGGTWSKADFTVPTILPKPAATPHATPDPATECERLLAGNVLGDADVADMSPVRLPDDPRQETALLVSNLYRQGDKINIVTKYTVNADGKANPSGFGETIDRDELLERLATGQTAPQSDAGAWVRMNPMDGVGVADANVTDHRFILLESDSVPNGLWISLILRLPLPVAAIIDSGGKSAHAWLKVDCLDATEYRDTFEQLHKHLERFGLDRKNKNPGRLSRLAGVNRSIPAGARPQRLLFLNPSPAPLDWKALAEAVQLETDDDRRIRELFEGRLYRAGEDASDPIPVYSLCGVPCCTVGNITSLFAGEGVGKSAVIGAMIAAAIKPDGCNADCLGWTAEPIGQKCIVHLDTEQSREHRAKAIRRIASRVGLPDVGSNIISVRAHGLSWAECLRILSFTIKEALKRFPAGIHSVFIDGPGDLVPSVNDEEKSNGTIADLMLLAESHQTHVICVIHLNHGSLNESKMRGHMGSQLARKSETTLKLSSKDEVRTLFAPKTREKPIPEPKGPRFAWSDEKKMFVTVDNPEQEQIEAKFEVLKSQVAEAFSHDPKTMLSYTQLHRNLMEILKVKKTAADNKIPHLVNAGLIVKQACGFYTLA